MGAPAVPRPDATCELRLPATSYPKTKIKVLLLENISATAVAIFTTERFQVVRGCPYFADLIGLAERKRYQAFSIQSLASDRAISLQGGALHHH